MIAGYVTYNELKIITGYSDRLLTKLLVEGIGCHELEVVKGMGREPRVPVSQQVFNLKEVEDWLKIHVY